MKILPSKPDIFYSTIMGKKIICFGAGKMPVDAVKILKIRDVVEYFYDNANEKWNTTVGVQGKKYEVHNPIELKTLNDTHGLVILITNRDHYQDILQQISSFKTTELLEVFVYPEFNLEEVYSFQKTDKFSMIQKYWKAVRLNQKKKQFEIGTQLISNIFGDNKYWAKDLADQALETGNRRSALRIYTELVNAGYQSEQIMELIRRNFSSCSGSEETFMQNIRILNEYPYFFQTKGDGIEKQWLNFQEGNSVFPYNEEKGRFGYEIILNEPQNAFCKIEDSENPVLFNNIYNEYVLIYLSYIVRDSKKYGSDNYVYLYYESVEEFYNYLHFLDCSFLMERPKFVFMLGKENQKYYPLKNLTLKNEPEILSIDEMQHICILISNGACGSGFFTGVMSSNNYVVGNEDKEFYYYSQLPKNFNNILQDTSQKYTYQEVLFMLENNIDKIVTPMGDKPFTEYVHFFKKIFREGDIFNVTDIWRTYFIAKYYLDGGAKKTRFVPCIFWDIHNGKRPAFFNMLKEFALVDYFVPVRNPIIKLVRSYDRNLFGKTCENQYDDLTGRFISGFNQTFSYPDAFEHKFVAAKLEDCKLYPKEMFQKICYTLCIPYHDSMLKAEAPESGNIDGECIKGFDLLPLNRKIDHVFSDFDKVRLEIFYSQICEYYGYDYYDFDEQPLTDEEVKILFSKPFRIESELFDRCYTRVEEDMEWKRKFDFENTDLSGKKIWFDSKEEVRDILYKILIRGYTISRYEKIKFPFFIRKSIQDASH